MSQDIKIYSDDYKFKYRVSGILIVDNKLLTVCMNDNGFYCLPGGHVEMMENTKDAVIREFFEETRLKVNIDRLGFVVENFFTGRLGRFHELGFYYFLNTSEKIDIKDYTLFENDKEGTVKLDFKWIDLNKLDNFKPEFLKDELQKNNKYCKHFIIKDDKII